jgi:ribonuclease HII
MKNPNFKKELELWHKGYELIAGIDEVGRGAWAGPIVAAGVIFENKVIIKGLNDSKKLTAIKRESLAEEIKSKALAWVVQLVDNSIIDEIGVGRANALVIDKVINKLAPRPDYLLIDQASLTKYKIRIPWQTIIRGDSQVCSIAAASIIAKVARDNMMLELAKIYPQYGFEDHKGYGTQFHQQMLAKYAACPLHRRSYKPVSQPKLIST